MTTAEAIIQNAVVPLNLKEMLPVYHLKYSLQPNNLEAVKKSLLELVDSYADPEWTARLPETGLYSRTAVEWPAGLIFGLQNIFIELRGETTRLPW